jgi:hypothetical protein
VTLPESLLRGFAAAYAAELEAAGLTVYRDGQFTPIAATLTPEVIDDAELAELAADARLILSAVVKVAQLTLAHPSLSERLYRAFTPLEIACLTPARLAQVAVARVDYFRGPGGVRALEVNTTIPAMQGYSDLVQHAFLRHAAGALGLDPGPLIAAAGSNTADLLASLVAHYRLAGGRAVTPAILIVSRRGDSQLGELTHYVRAFTAAGHRARHAWVDEIEIGVGGRVRAGGEPWDLLYRHIFARRVERGSVMADLLLDPGPNIVLNPVNGPLEVKGILALLHEAAAGEGPAAAAPLDDDEREATFRRLPWTRLCIPAPATLPDGSSVPDLAAWAAEHPETLVLKKSWDYGGKGVHLGPDTPDWAARAGAAAGDEHLWVLQELVRPKPVRHLLAEPGGPTWRDLYVDINSYANLGVTARPRGGVARASAHKVVNIAGGGGVAPLIARSIYDTLAARSAG